MRTNEAYLIQRLLQKGSQPPSLQFGRDSKAGRRVEKLYSKQKASNRLRLEAAGTENPEAGC